MSFLLQITCLLSSVLLFSLGVYGLTRMENNYNPIWYMRKTSYFRQYAETYSDLFPQNGEHVQVFVGGIKYWNHLEAMRNITNVLEFDQHIRNGSIKFWFTEFYYAFCYGIKVFIFEQKKICLITLVISS